MTLSIVKPVALAAVVLLVTAACAPWRQSREDARWEPSQTPCVGAGQHADGCAVQGSPHRDFSVFVPSGYTESEPMPVVVFLHGGGGGPVTAQSTTCPDNDTSSPSCLWAVGEEQGFITVFPTGYAPRPASPFHTWNAGGGGDWACASGAACEDGSDDIGYLNDVLDQVEAQWHVDGASVYVIGFSNGAAMAHRVGCEMADRVTAIAAVSGANEFAMSAECAPSEPVAVLHIHGTADQCWSYETSLSACADFQDQPKVGVAESTNAWLSALNCEPDPSSSAIPDRDPQDGTTSTQQTYRGCDGGVEVSVITIEGGGHVFPGGAKVEATGRTDTATKDFGAPEVWEWLSRWSR